MKRQDGNRRFKLLLRLLGRYSKLTITNKLLIFKTVLRPAWTYGIELWGSARKSNLNRLQVLQSKILRVIVDAPFYVSNLTLHRDLNIPFVKDLVRSRYVSFHSSLKSHPNPLIRRLSGPSISGNPCRRLRRQWPRDLL